MPEKNSSKMPDLPDRAEQDLEITTRDDQASFPSLLDASRISRRNGGRLRLIDTGRFSVFELEWLAEAGADIYTSDAGRPKKEELDLLAKACARGNAVIAYFHHGDLTGDAADVPTSWAFLKEIARRGIDLHLSSREKARDFTELGGLAEVCRRAGTRLVYYHHGPFEPALGILAQAGGWIHLSAENLDGDAGTDLLEETARDAAAARSGVVIHLEKGLPVETLRNLLRSGAFLIFKTPPEDRRSRIRAVEERARKKKLDRRSYYLHTTFLP
ncbi:MAG: hypothetical protein JXE07_02080 [Candidatus Aminicenantes bacterium]|nr:hypothetical protein [Candidatus Aminicenantes bacterium]